MQGISLPKWLEDWPRFWELLWNRINIYKLKCTQDRFMLLIQNVEVQMYSAVKQNKCITSTFTLKGIVMFYDIQLLCLKKKGSSTS